MNVFKFFFIFTHVHMYTSFVLWIIMCIAILYEDYKKEDKEKGPSDLVAALMVVAIFNLFAAIPSVIFQLMFAIAF